jgi:hypothetical protein
VHISAFFHGSSRKNHKFAVRNNGKISVSYDGLNKTKGSEVDATNINSSGAAVRRKDLKSCAGLHINWRVRGKHSPF